MWENVSPLLVISHVVAGALGFASCWFLVRKEERALKKRENGR